MASAAVPTYSALTLTSPWESAQTAFGTGNPTVALDAQGIVHLSGAAIPHGASSDSELAVLDAKYRPSTRLYLPIATDTGDRGVLQINTDGTMYVVGSPLAYASLANVSFPAASSSFAPTPVTLKHDWQSANAADQTGRPAASVTSNGIVRLSGSLQNGDASTTAFVLPAAERPAFAINVPVSTYGYTSGYLTIESNGHVTPMGSFAADFTSLAGVTFVAKTATLPMTKLTPIGVWTVSGGAEARGGVDGLGIVHLQGVLTNATQTGPEMFVLPAKYRPTHTVFVPIANNGDSMVKITPSGSVTTYGANAVSTTDLDPITFPAAR
jgi:hypothetical protein